MTCNSPFTYKIKDYYYNQRQKIRLTCLTKLITGKQFSSIFLIFSNKKIMVIFLVKPATYFLNYCKKLSTS